MNRFDLKCQRPFLRSEKGSPVSDTVTLSDLCLESCCGARLFTNYVRKNPFYYKSSPVSEHCDEYLLRRLPSKVSSSLTAHPHPSTTGTKNISTTLESWYDRPLSGRTDTLLPSRTADRALDLFSSKPERETDRTSTSSLCTVSVRTSTDGSRSRKRSLSFQVTLSGSRPDLVPVVIFRKPDIVWSGTSSHHLSRVGREESDSRSHTGEDPTDGHRAPSCMYLGTIPVD